MNLFFTDKFSNNTVYTLKSIAPPCHCVSQPCTTPLHPITSITTFNTLYFLPPYPRIHTPISLTPLTPHPHSTGATSASKVATVRQRMTSKSATTLVLTALDEVAWLLNIRGSDISYCPVFFSYCIVTMQDVKLAVVVVAVVVVVVVVVAVVFFYIVLYFSNKWDNDSCPKKW